MTTFNESVRQILLDVQVYLNETLKNEKIGDKAKTKKNNIADAILRLQEEYPCLKADDKPRADDESIFTTSSVNSEEDGHYSENKIVDVSVAALKNPIKTGYLEKRKRSGMMVRSGYQRRYCVVCEAVLYYFEKPTDKKQRGAFHLNGYEFRPAPNLVKDTTKKNLSFELVGPGKRTYEFLAENEDEFYSWKQTVLECHDKPIDEEIYEFIEEQTPQKSKKEESDGSETYEEPDVEAAPKVPDTRKLQTISTARPLPPPLPGTLIPDIPPAIQRRGLPAVPRAAKLDIPKINPKEDYENMYYSKWNCASDGDNELELKKGDIIHVLSKDFDQEKWWVAELKGNIGLVPKDYLAKAYEVGP